MFSFNSIAVIHFKVVGVALGLGVMDYGLLARR